MLESKDQVLLKEALRLFLSQDELSNTDSIHKTSAQFTFTNFGFYKVSRLSTLNSYALLKKEERRQNYSPFIMEMGTMLDKIVAGALK